MATKSKELQENIVTEEKKKVTKVDKEKEELKNKLKEQEEQMKALQEKLDAILAGTSLSAQPVKKKDKKNIKIINLTAGGFTLKGNRFYHLDKQFDYMLFSENEAKTIVNNMPQSIANGFIYIADAEFVDECELDGIYKSILDDQTLKTLLNRSADDVCEIYKNCSDEQKKIILDMISGKKMDNQIVDANILVKLGELSGRDLIGIEPLNEE